MFWFWVIWKVITEAQKHRGEEQERSVGRGEWAEH